MEISASDCSIGNTCFHNEEEEMSTDCPPIDLETLLNALSLLTEFASQDTGTYRSSFSLSMAATPKESGEEKNRNSLRRLEQLLLQKNVQPTPLPALWRTVHRLHSMLTVLQQNEAQNVTEVTTLMDELNKVKQENANLADSVKMLKERNDLLQQKLERKRFLLKQARQFFATSQKLQKDLEQQNTVFKLQAHEQFLLISNRVRFGSADSNFSDVDALFFADTALPASTAIRGEDDNVSLHSGNSGSSLISDEEVPVVKLSPDDAITASSTMISTRTSSDLSDMSDDHLFYSCHVPGGPLKHPASPCLPDVYKMTFPRGKKVGLRFQSIPVQDLPLPPKGILTHQLFKDPESMEGGRKDGPRFTNQEEVRGHAIVVSSYDGTYWHSENPRPTLGARVVDINGQLVDPTWSLRKFLEVLAAVSGTEYLSVGKSNGENVEEDVQQEIVTDDGTTSVSSLDDKNNKSTFYISFRNDALTKRQRERLSSSDRVDKEHRDALSGDNGRHDKPFGLDKTFGLGFLRTSQDDTLKETETSTNQPVSHTKDQHSSKGKNPLFFWDQQKMDSTEKRVPPSSDEPALKGKNPLFFWDRMARSDQEPKAEVTAENHTANDDQTVKGKNLLFFWDRGTADEKPDQLGKDLDIGGQVSVEQNVKNEMENAVVQEVGLEQGRETGHVQEPLVDQKIDVATEEGKFHDVKTTLDQPNQESKGPEAKLLKRLPRVTGFPSMSFWSPPKRKMGDSISFRLGPKENESPPINSSQNAGFEVDGGLPGSVAETLNDVAKEAGSKKPPEPSKLFAESWKVEEKSGSETTTDEVNFS